jgi:hypothetical protein
LAKRRAGLGFLGGGISASPVNEMRLGPMKKRGVGLVTVIGVIGEKL